MSTPEQSSGAVPDTVQARECEYRCVTAADVGMPEVGGMVDIDPGCPVHDAPSGTAPARDVAALSDALALIDRLMPVLLPGEDWSRGVSWRADRAESFQRERDRLRALLGTGTTATATPAEVWAAALADGSGSHVSVRKHWPELAAALDAAVAGAVPDAGRPTAAAAAPSRSSAPPRRLRRGHSCPHCDLTLVYPMSGTTLFCPTSERTYEIGAVADPGQAREAAGMERDE